MKNNFFKCLLSLTLAAGMVLSPVSGTPQTKAAEKDADLVARYPLTSDVKDVSGNGNDASIPVKASGVSFQGEALTLSGGASTSSNYVKLPEGMFDGKDSLTISMWIKNNNTKKNTAAFSFCGKTKQGTSPKHYLILNPSNPDGYYKAVFTDPVPGSTANPWNTEIGVNNSFNNSVLTSNRMNEWMYYTITIDKNSISGYLDGKRLGAGTLSNMSVSDFGSGIASYIGKSDYPDDLFAGSFRDLRIYSKTMTEAEVSALYEKASAIQNVKEASASMNLGEGMEIIENLNLPTAYGDCKITWKTSDASVVETNGTVHFKEEEQKVTLTAVITNGTYSEEKVVELTIASKGNVEGSKYRMGLLIPRFVSEDLQSTVSGKSVSWSCDKEGIIAQDGKVIRPSQDTKVRVSATIDGVTLSKEVTVMAEGGQIASYVTQGGNLYQNTGDLLAATDSRRSDALFLAAKTVDENTYTELNKGKAVMYVKWNGAQTSSTDNQMGSPVLFRKADGSLAAAASGNNNRNGIYIWDTEENLAFSGERFLELASAGTKVQNPTVIFDELSGAYKVFWQDGNGKSYVSLLADMNEGSSPIKTEEISYTKTPVSGILPENAVTEEAGVFEASKKEYEAILKKYGTVHNTDVESVNVTLRPGETLTMPETVKALYNDGSSKNLGVVWDEDALAKIDTSKEGTYEIPGEVQQDAYAYPFIEERADPHVFYNKDDGYYYSTGSYYEENMTAPSCAQSYRKLDIRRAKTIEGLKTAKEYYILESKVGDRWGGFFWAPEFHKINGTWYCLVGAHDFGTSGIADNVNWNNANWCSRSILIPYEGTEEQMKAGGMLDASQWGDPIILENLPSFDISYYEDESGQGYYIIPQSAQISIMKVKGGDGVVPQATGERVVLKSGDWPWEYGIYEGSINASRPEGTDQLVVEGPYLFEYGDKVYISYSAATVDKFYTLGLMMADKGSNIMDPSSWTNVSYPLLSSYDTYKGQIGGGAHVGGGHNSVVLDEYGNLALVYHARPYPDPHTGQGGSGGLFDPCRHTVVKSINVAADGTLIFNMTAEEELSPEYRTVTATVTVAEEKPNRPFVDVDMETGDWYYNAVYYNFERKIMNGVNETHFEPMSNLARAQFAIILHNMEGKPGVAYEAKFKDVAEGEWYTDAILWASSKEIVTGYTDGSEMFGWGDKILREQMAVMMYRYAKNFKEYDVSDSADFDNFADAALVSGYAKEAMKWAVGAGIITGKDLDKDGTPESIDPLGNASRAECAIIMQRFLEKYGK